MHGPTSVFGGKKKLNFALATGRNSLPDKLFPFLQICHMKAARNGGNAEEYMLNHCSTTQTRQDNIRLQLLATVTEISSSL